MIIGVFEELIGNTPLINVDGILAKLETTNLSGSVKDRMALYMLSQAEKRGELKPGGKILEVTSGNTGISFAMISAAKGYKFTAVMSEGMSLERRHIMKAFGAKIVMTPAKEDIIGAIKKYDELVKEDSSVWLPKQFENPDNPEAHRIGLGAEILKEVKDIDVFVAGIGSGGTIIGVAQALKKANPKIKIIGVEPAESAVFSGRTPGLHKIQGIGEGFVPKIVKDNISLIDEVVSVKSKDAIFMSKNLAKKHGLLVGISSGANIFAAKQLKKKYRVIVTILPDRGERYLG